MVICAEGDQNKEVTAKLGLDRQIVEKWWRRFVERRVTGLHDEPRSGAPRTIEDARIEAVIVRTLGSCPENATRWSSRGMAKTSGLSMSTEQRMWRAFGPEPHRMETFKLFDRCKLRGQSARFRGPLRLAGGARPRSVCG
ncbi:helix-turn-helix domain-containing protein [Bradyrhizobium sp. TZ2]